MARTFHKPEPKLNFLATSVHPISIFLVASDDKEQLALSFAVASIHCPEASISSVFELLQLGNKVVVLFTIQKQIFRQRLNCLRIHYSRQGCSSLISTESSEETR
ncbi:hypothetical protein GUJ93_ZPchr0007g4363 [Zizania palustris]|uniref:Uncharacterized protein n=1 Tax=Zizania palustris TaxID=103762 RepID=A0A8J5T759_ZIZPA|nr:hypothetical protein GUJ93_ZPchr0007g4363 [Zizania palustris]